MSEMKPANQPSLEPSGDAVKEAKPVGKTLGRTLGGKLQGWEAAGTTVMLVVVAALLSVPRAAQPRLFPVPLVDVREASATRQHTAELADTAERDGLPFETRAVGDAVRRWGTALSSGVGDAGYLNRLTYERVQMALHAEQTAPLLRLQALQSRLFVRSVRAHDWKSAPSDELKALGGDFAERAHKSGWVERDTCVASDDELATLFSLRWLELTGLREMPRFKPTLGELRRYYRFLLLYPEQNKGQLALPARRLRYAEALAKYDGEYPIALARGILQAELGRADAASAQLSAYLGQNGGAGWQLLARNYLLYATGDLADDGGDFAPAEVP
jgi:hypothetical protein